MATIKLLKDNEFLKTATRLVEQAKKSIYISTFKAEIISKPRGTKLKEFFELLKTKAAGGIEIRVLINAFSLRGHIPPTNVAAVAFFTGTNISVRHLPNERICHAKMLLVDSESAIIGSHNLGVKSCHYNFEVSCLVYNKDTVTPFVDAFVDMWDKSIVFPGCKR